MISKISLVGPVAVPTTIQITLIRYYTGLIKRDREKCKLLLLLRTAPKTKMRILYVRRDGRIMYF